MFVEGNCFREILHLLFSTMGPVLKHWNCCEVLLLFGEASWGSSLVSQSAILQWVLERFVWVREIGMTDFSRPFFLTNQSAWWKRLLERFKFVGVSRQFTWGLLECFSYDFFSEVSSHLLPIGFLKVTTSATSAALIAGVQHSELSVASEA